MGYKRNYVTAIIVAAGMGKRMNAGINKQFISIKGYPVVYYTLKKFNECEYIDDIILVAREEEIDYCKQFVVDKYNINKVTKIVAGGKERQHSVYNGLINASSKTDVVLVHDGARPFVKKESIIEGIKGAVNYEACIIGVPVKDTIKVIDVDKNVIDTPDRKTLWAVQTPQCFSYNLLIKAYTKAFEDGFVGTDDSSLVERLGYKVKMIEGSYDNIKITTPEDLEIANAILEKS